jgi:SRSO17 transposase
VRQIKNDANSFGYLARRFMEFSESFSEFFVVRGKDSSQHARAYLSGLLGKQQRKNIGQIEEDVAESNYQAMQQLVSDSPWDHHGVMAAVAGQADGMIGGHRDSALYLDESGFAKKGTHSVGVQRQYCGRLGKIENCQVGVFACLSCHDRSALVDFRLFLPEPWAQDAERCAKAKVPEAERRHRTKTELALEMVKQARERGVRFQWVGGDEVYGNNRQLTDALEEEGEVFLMDVASNVKVWERNPRPVQPQQPPRIKKGTGMGRPLSRTKASDAKARYATVAELTKEEFHDQARVITVRESTKGKLKYRIWVKEVWQWEVGQSKARRRLLVVREEADGSFKYSLTNAAANTSWERLGFMQAQRFWIERSFQDAKSELGMADYEVRSWRGWHHHMALVCMALLFITQERLLAFEDTPLLSARDIVELLAYYLPRRNSTAEEIERRIHRRHTLRAKAIESGRKRNKFVTK